MEKRVQYIKNKSLGFLFSFSIPDESLQITNKKVVRCINYFNIQIIEEREDHWWFTNYGQSDFKMFIPESMLNFTIPMKFCGWFEEYHKFLKTIKN